MTEHFSWPMKASSVAWAAQPPATFVFSLLDLRPTEAQIHGYGGYLSLVICFDVGYMANGLRQQYQARPIFDILILDVPWPLCKIHDNATGAFLVTDNRVFNGLLWRSLHSFTRTTYSAYSLHSATLRDTRSLHSFAPFTGLFTPLLDGWYFWICVHAINAFDGNE